MTETTIEVLPKNGEALTASVAPRRDGRFKPGTAWNGNKDGRAKGTKNRITVQRLLTEESLRLQLEPSAPALLAKAIEMAMGTPATIENGKVILPAIPGNDRIMRALLDKLLATPKNDSDDNAKDTAVSITIKNLTVPEKPVLTITKQKQSLISDGVLLDVKPVPPAD